MPQKEQRALRYDDVTIADELQSAAASDGGAIVYGI
jgi:hypothetical protein